MTLRYDCGEVITAMVTPMEKRDSLTMTKLKLWQNT